MRNGEQGRLRWQVRRCAGVVRFVASQHRLSIGEEGKGKGRLYDGSCTVQQRDVFEQRVQERLVADHLARDDDNEGASAVALDVRRRASEERHEPAPRARGVVLSPKPTQASVHWANRAGREGLGLTASDGLTAD